MKKRIAVVGMVGAACLMVGLALMPREAPAQEPIRPEVITVTAGAGYYEHSGPAAQLVDVTTFATGGVCTVNLDYMVGGTAGVTIRKLASFTVLPPSNRNVTVSNVWMWPKQRLYISTGSGVATHKAVPTLLKPLK
jgi:hypothetical protein